MKPTEEDLLRRAAAAESLCEGLKKANALLTAGMESQCEEVHSLKQRARLAEAQVERLQGIVEALAARVASQSELLARHAERGET